MRNKLIAENKVGLNMLDEFGNSGPFHSFIQTVQRTSISLNVCKRAQAMLRQHTKVRARS